MKYSLIFIFAFIRILSVAQVPQGDRILGWQVDMSENNNYDSAFDYALKGCMQTISLAIPWSSIEPNNGEFDQNYIDNVLKIANIYYPAFGTKVELQIFTMNTVVKELPKDLLNTNFDNPVMIERFKKLLDKLFEHIPNIELTVLNIGNESDGIMGTDAKKYLAYKKFLNEVIPYAKQLYLKLHQEDLKVGTTFTYHGLTDKSTRSLCQSVNKDLDVVSVTYYPLNNDFTMKDPSVVSDDFNQIVSIYPSLIQPIYFVECGYSSSLTCNSSDDQQALFWHNVFNAWDDHVDNIKYLMIFKSTDWSQQEVDDFGKYYGIMSQEFLEYLRTLGVRTWKGHGRSKPAYDLILCELKSRGWCNAKCTYSSLQETDYNSNNTIIPNPILDQFSIKIPHNVSGKISVIIRSINGSIVKTIDNYEKDKNIKMNEYKSGLYIVQIMTSNQIISKIKLVKL